MRRNLGKGHAVRAGLARVFDGDFTHVLLLDGDMQHLPEEAAALLERRGPWRRRRRASASGSSSATGCRRRAITRTGSAAGRCRGSSAFPLDDTQCGFRVFRVDALRPLRLSATGYEIETEMLIKVRRRGGRVASVPVTAVYAGQRSKLRPVPRHDAHLFSGGVLSIP